MDQPIGGIKLEITGDIRGLQKAVAEGKVSVEQLGKFLEQKIDKSTTAAERSVNRLVKELTGVRPTAQLNQLDVALQKIGGTTKLTEIQLGNLKKRIDTLYASGGALPAGLQGLTTSTQGLAAAVNNIKAEGLQRLTGSAGQLAPVMAALGPAGLAAGAGIMATAGAATMAAKTLLDAAAGSVKYASANADASALAKMTAEAYQELSLSASLVGATGESVAASVTKLNNALVETPERFGAIGLSAAQLRGLAPEEQFRMVAEALETIEDPAYRDVLAIDLLGKKASEVTLTMKAFAEGGAERFRELGAVMDNETVAALDKVDDELTVLQKTWEGFWNNIGAATIQGTDTVGLIKDLTDAIGLLSRSVQTDGPIVSKGIRGMLAFGTGGVSEGAFSFIRGLGAQARAANTEDFLNYNTRGTPAQIAALDGLGAGAEGGILGSAITDYDQFIKMNPAVATAIAKIREERKKLTEETKKAAEEEKRYQQELRQMEVGRQALAMDEVMKKVRDLGGMWKIAADELERYAKQFAGTQHAVPFLMEQARRSGADAFTTPGLALPPGFAMDQLAARPGMQTLLGQMQANLSVTTAPGLIVPSRPPAIEYGGAEHLDLIAQAQGFRDFASATAEAQRNITETVRRTEQGAKAQMRWNEILAASADFAALFGDRLGGVGDLLNSGAGLMAGAKGFKSALKFNDGKFDWKGTDKAAAATAGIGVLGGLYATGRDQGVIMGGLAGASTGASMGAQFGPVGAVVGGVVGAGAGIFGGIMGGKERQKLAQTAVGAARSTTGFAAMDEFLKKVEAGGLSADEMASSFDAAFSEIIPNAISKTTGLLDANADRMMELAETSGIASEAIKQLMEAQAQALSTNLAGGIASMRASREKGGPGLQSQGAATGIGASLAANFDIFVKQGMSANEALKTLAPSVQAFRDELNITGFEGGAAFDALSHRIEILTGEVTGPLVEGIGSFSGALANMSNLGMLTQEIFSGITSQIGANIEALKVEGVEGPAAIAALQPQLQTIWELQQKHGFAVDETTQKLIDLGLENKQIGPEFQEAGEKMQATMERVAVAVERMAIALEHGAAGAGKLGMAIAAIPTEKTINLNYKSNGGGGLAPSPFAGEIPEFATGTLATGSLFQNFGAETIAALHGLEAVMTPAQLGAMTSTTYAVGVAAGTSRSGAGMDFGPLLSEIRALRHDQMLLRDAVKVSVQAAVLKVIR